MSWSDKYVGIPFVDLGRTRDGCDCYGLKRLIYREELGITLPDYLGYGCVSEVCEIAALIEGAQHSPIWQPVNGNISPFDVAVFRRGHMQTHLGVVINRYLMIHIEHNSHAVIGHYDRGPWSHRLTGIWRHAEVRP